MRFIVSGGGTGGHIYPALAIAGGLKQRFPGCSVMYIGTNRGLEADIVPKAGYRFHAVRAVGIKRSLSWHNLKVPWEAWAGYREARRLIRGFAPRAVVGTGGYVCGPVLLAAARLKIPTLIHEQNALPGITNRILSRFVDRVAVTFEDALPFFPRRAPVRLTGLPVRSEVLTAERELARERFGVHQGELLVLSFGGSQGARTLNRAVARAITHLAGIPEVRLLHVTGSGQYQQFMDMLAKEGFGRDMPDNVTVVPYLYEMPEALAAADLVVSRAGAATLAEITVRGLPALLVPFPYATGNHQEHNARALVSRGAAEMVADAEFSGSTLVGVIEKLLADRSRLEEMAEASRRLGKPGALDDIIGIVEEII
ncbi:undecaprenyldiphospho-muramoylpentapeptide beta-N-acetylglucosaminyltransferase [Desulfallas thermosapovorans]|uniref:UDP-N-acetylglucosamine--N-acetylmuramyl-(pentapeptide) pyrophosphoryl-undecaprenol N-acetylglucosamine transferase n=1 Tax=Desulfallas thermosapovorans DSM 6562 TaxID=1121431 RepID=A0A5S4ZUL8_9FIRM|nr:undecaprenyldiphospho-muramoylpentapeptide beta-N-acetylglucosaminyltransferase [Desulfallas thermosapovorans]TYO95915.1 UDP-N-acetylglucosamine-N-acetylmuramylpentapeptide N-acetylglucosamine transferase [Desulfallas thermosapovorans DSM 6562]